jgi:excinuclease ABC subunit A
VEGDAQAEASRLGDRRRRDWKGNWKSQWYGVKRFFDWLESKAYKMHIRVLLSRTARTRPAPTCDGARLKPDALLWRVGSCAEANTRSRASAPRPVAGRYAPGVPGTASPPAGTWT